jgi:hypothetical protein
MKDRDNSWHFFGFGGIDSYNLSVGDRAGYCDSIGEFFDRVVSGIFSAARNFQLSIYACDWFPNY